jgi:hypothetical protein
MLKDEIEKKINYKIKDQIIWFKSTQLNLLNLQL